jgi:hypothetical protein
MSLVKSAASASILLAFAMASHPAGAALHYTEVTTIAVPTDSANMQPGGAFTAFDISYFDPTTGLDYVADRSNAAVDIFSGATNAFVGRATGFAGQQATTSLSGPDGVVVTPSHTLFAGDAPSLLRTFNVSTPSAPVPQFAPINTGGTFRVDEMAYAPGPNLVLVANNADTPAFGTIVNASTGAIVASHITIPGQIATGGLEQSVWNPNTGTFFISVPTFNGTDPGGVAEISTSGSVLRTFHLDTLSSGGITSCSPAGLALGGSGNLMVACGNAGTQTVILNPAGNGGAGTILTKVSQISGSDEIYYDPVTGDFYVTGTSGGQRVFDVIADSTYAVLQSIALPNVNAHSIAVDPLNGDVFVPLEGTTTAGADPLCPGGCIAVFANVPEPSSLPLFMAGMTFLGIAGWRFRRS